MRSKESNFEDVERCENGGPIACQVLRLYFRNKHCLPFAGMDDLINNAASPI
jgi:hypothetical protein